MPRGKPRVPPSPSPSSSSDANSCEWAACSLPAFDDAEGLCNHILQQHVETISVLNEVRILCGWKDCGVVVAGTKRLGEHIRKHLPKSYKPFACALCPLSDTARFTTVSGLGMHRWKTHNIRSPWKMAAARRKAEPESVTTPKRRGRRAPTASTSRVSPATSSSADTVSTPSKISEAQHPEARDSDEDAVMDMLSTTPTETDVAPSTPVTSPGVPIEPPDIDSLDTDDDDEQDWSLS
ncbi:hypothetical protein EXIGLDRAFT_362622 [Exidia glandulosa HHB12029]|uniref:C2H2-type domain-containing protein n=1 Tax=Exidia glandulosa HHB12029 TaxID=1314781 RepID=A0A165ZE45_EXIGL|nr:hypothetical protein EXIGLDRAFT_362622 [Exidia glandulosa HHB12029]